jgi:hypothetical protein
MRENFMHGSMRGGWQGPLAEPVAYSPPLRGGVACSHSPAIADARLDHRVAAAQIMDTCPRLNGS